MAATFKFTTEDGHVYVLTFEQELDAEARRASRATKMELLRAHNRRRQESFDLWLEAQPFREEVEILQPLSILPTLTLRAPEGLESALATAPGVHTIVHES